MDFNDFIRMIALQIARDKSRQVLIPSGEYERKSDADLRFKLL